MTLNAACCSYSQEKSKRNSTWRFFANLVLCLLFAGAAVRANADATDFGDDWMQMSLDAHRAELSQQQAQQIDQAVASAHAGRFVESAAQWRSLFTLEQQADNPSNKSFATTILLGHAYSQYRAGNIKIANNALQLALKRFAAATDGDALSMSGAYYLSAKIELARYQLDKAIQHLRLSQQWLNSRQINIPAARRQALFAKISLAEGETLYVLDKYKAAKHALDVALRWAQQAQDQDLQIASHSALLAFLLRTTDVPSVKQIQQALIPVSMVESGDEKQQLLYADMVSQIPQKRWPTIKTQISQINLLLDRIVADSASTLAKSYANGIKARLFQEVGQWSKAEELLLKSIREAQQYGDKLQLSRWLSAYGAIKNQQGDYPAGLRAYRMAVQHFDAIKSDVGYGYQRQLYYPENYSDDIYSGLADMLLRQSSQQASPQKQQSLLSEARNVLETKKNVDLQDYFHDQCIANFKNKRRKLDEVAAADTAIFYPIVLPNRIELLLSHNGKLTRYVSYVTRKQLRKKVLTFRHQLMDVSTESYMTTARQLYDWIIRPMQSGLDEKEIKNLVIVSESLLRTVPFSVFNDGQRFLVQKYALALSPALSLTDPQKIKRGDVQVLLGGLSESVQGFPALSFVKGELEEIQDLYANELLLNRDFVTSRFEAALKNPQFSIAHVASHSEMSFDSRRSYILTFDGKISFDQLGSMTSLQSRHRPIELLTLSACQTAAGDDRAALGLAGVAVKSGARSALATLWAIDDLASSLLVSEFYRQLSDASVSKAQALRNAQKSLIRSHRFGHPAYWSSFLLIGNWL